MSGPEVEEEEREEVELTTSQFNRLPFSWYPEGI